ncbi:MAG: hypothetical protein MGG37_20325, partial [Trichodesmium sp. MAG_R01]|nr:hypothetical protein [Trichodesmium sp. MAG_R01]
PRPYLFPKSWKIIRIMEFHPSLQCLITYSLILSFLGLPILDDTGHCKILNSYLTFYPENGTNSLRH